MHLLIVMVDDAQRHKRRRTIEENVQAMLEYAGPSLSVSDDDLSICELEQTGERSPTLSEASGMTYPFGSLEISSESELFCGNLDNNSDVSAFDELSQHLSNGSTGSDNNIFAGMINQERDGPGLHEMLQFWAVSKGISHSSLRDILHILKPYHPDLPLDPRTLLSTGTVDGVRPIEGGGFYYHFRVEDGVKRWSSDKENAETDVHLQFNNDGLPIFKSSRIQLWPILAMVKAPALNSKPFVCGSFMGRQKPPGKFLDEFVQEMVDLMANGLEYNNRQFRVHLHSFV